jgi:hypothetical protein
MFPSPKECPGVVGAAIGLVGATIAVLLLLVWNVVPLGWYLLVGFGGVLWISVLFCLLWEWDHFPYVGS